MVDTEDAPGFKLRQIELGQIELGQFKVGQFQNHSLFL
jgi:hypothetical protein